MRRGHHPGYYEVFKDSCCQILFYDYCVFSVTIWVHLYMWLTVYNDIKEEYGGWKIDLTFPSNINFHYVIYWMNLQEYMYCRCSQHTFTIAYIKCPPHSPVDTCTCCSFLVLCHLFYHFAIALCDFEHARK